MPTEHELVEIVDRAMEERTQEQVNLIAAILMQHGLDAPEQFIHAAARAALSAIRGMKE